MAPLFDATVANTYWGEFRAKWHTLRVAEKVPCQVAHTTGCRKRIMDLMREDLEERLRVQLWDEDHGRIRKGDDGMVRRSR